MKLAHRSARLSISATRSSRSSGAKPFAARKRTVFVVKPRRATTPASRSRSGASDARAVRATRLVDAVAHEVVDDELVPRVTFRDRPSASHGVALVVDEPRALGAVERVPPLRPAHPGARETSLQARPAVLPSCERTQRHLVRTAPPKRPGKLPGTLAVERNAGAQSRDDGSVDGNGAPRNTVDLDRDAVPERADGGDGGRPPMAVAGPLGQASEPTSSGTGETSTTPTSALGSRRAETSCSGPASAWIRVRIVWTRSGFSVRNAVAF